MMLTLDEARERVGAAVRPLAPLDITLQHAIGHRVAVELRSDVDHPPGAVSAMDGYALHHEDLTGGAPLPVVMEVQAGSPPRKLPPGSVARIFTGAVLPTGADTVVPQERAEPAGDGLVRLENLAAGSNVRAAGQIFRRGDTVITRGSLLTPTRIALAAAAGCARVRVHPRPAVALLSTGSELVPAGEFPQPGQIRDSNTPMLTALASTAGLEVAHVAHARDDLDVLTAALGAAAEWASLIVTAGGVSVGDYDLVPHALERLEGETIFHGVKMRPGKPLLLGRIGESWLVGLPGNPVSALAGWRLFARPLAEALAGAGDAFDEDPIKVTVRASLSNPGDRLLLHPCRVIGSEAQVLAWRGSHDIRGVADATGFLRVEPGTAVTTAAARFGCYPLPWRLGEAESTARARGR